jgi:hypothetical protein
MEEEINFKIPLKTEEELDNAVEYFTNTIQSATWQCTPQEKTKREYQYCPQEIQDFNSSKKRTKKKIGTNTTPCRQNKIETGIQ